MRKIGPPSDAIARACASTCPASASAFRKTPAHKTKIAIARTMNAPTTHASSDELSIAWKKGFIVSRWIAFDQRLCRRGEDSDASRQTIRSRENGTPLFSVKAEASCRSREVIVSNRESYAGDMSRPTRDIRARRKRSFKKTCGADISAPQSRSIGRGLADSIRAKVKVRQSAQTFDECLAVNVKEAVHQTLD